MSSEVKAIDKRTVHQICSGQVVLSLAVAVKELVENSLDAGATSVEVKLKDHGLELVEVSDNGCGVAPDNFAALTLKHHTSKLSEFDDLLTVTTFGFRGEALSSLCALSNLEVTTCHRSQSVATRIQYDSNGHIKSQTHCAREVGTTVSLHNLFHTLPVRYKEFQRNAKKEFSRMAQMLQGYCLISTGVRISCHNQIGKGKRQLVLSTTDSSSVKENIVSVFGQKQLQSCVEVRECGREDVEEGDGESDPATLDALQLFRLTGYVSRCTHGSGRSTTDRQFYFCNGRPIEHPRLSKAVNEVYHMYNRQQNPFVVLDINTNRECVDVNVTPDKRKIILQQEKALLLLVKASLHKLYHPMQAAYESSSVGATTGDKQSVDVSPTCALLSKLSSLKRTASCGDAGADRVVCKPPRPKQPKLSQYGMKSQSNGNSHSMCLEKECDSIGEQATGTHNGNSRFPTHRITTIDCNLHSSNTTDNSSSTATAIPSPQRYHNPANGEDDEIVDSCVVHLANKEHNVGDTTQVMSTTSHDCRYLTDATSMNREGALSYMTTRTTNLASMEHRSVVCDMTAISQRLRSKLRHGDKEVVERGNGGVVEGVEEKEGGSGELGEGGRRRMRFRAKIKPDESESAEAELRKEISIPMFSKMHVIGQFNLGFIVMKLADNLFIIDQHASDEKFNFERLQTDGLIENQKLIQPKLLELTAVSENIIMDNLDVFRMNGFHFRLDPTAAPTKRLRLVSQPVYRGHTLGRDEIDEMVFLLSDSPGEMVRPSKVRQMFASRACRMSVMIGKALNRAEMKKLVCNMSKMKQPWNCPHGRPTLRHLVDLSLL